MEPSRSGPHCWSGRGDERESRQAVTGEPGGARHATRPVAVPSVEMVSECRMVVSSTATSQLVASAARLTRSTHRDELGAMVLTVNQNCPQRVIDAPSAPKSAIGAWRWGAVGVFARSESPDRQDLVPQIEPRVARRQIDCLWAARAHSKATTAQASVARLIGRPGANVQTSCP